MAREGRRERILVVEQILNIPKVTELFISISCLRISFDGKVLEHNFEEPKPTASLRLIEVLSDER